MKNSKKIKIKLKLCKIFAPYFDTPNELLEYCDSVLLDMIGRESHSSKAIRDLLNHEDAENSLVK